MGRIKTILVKRTSKRLFDEHADEFKESFDENKHIVTKFADIPSKKLKNVIAGYVTRLVKTREKL